METQIEDIKKAWLALRRSQRLSLLEEFEFVQIEYSWKSYTTWPDSMRQKYRKVMLKNSEFVNESIDWHHIIDLKKHDEVFFYRSIK